MIKQIFKDWFIGEDKYDTINLIRGYIGIFVIAGISLYFGFITPAHGLFGSQIDIINKDCLAGSQMCPW